MSDQDTLLALLTLFTPFLTLVLIGLGFGIASVGWHRYKERRACADRETV